MDNIIQISDLNKSFGEVHAVKNLTFNVKRGELFAFLGVNGAGKSTTIQIMCGLLKQDSGTVIIDGKAAGEDKSVALNTGIVFQSSVLDKGLNVYDNLCSRAALYGICGKAFTERLEQLSKAFELDGILKRQVGKLSGGQRRKIDIARALVHRPKLLILDEPTTGLDPQTRKNIWNVIEGLRKNEGMTVFLTTHYMEEAAEADYIVILNEGNKVAEGTPVELKNKYTGDFITFYGVEKERLNVLGKEAQRVPGGYKIEVKDTAEATRLITAHPDIFTDYEIIKGKMDDVFLAVTGYKGGDEQ